MPTDLAVALDTLVDGEADPTKGKFRQYPDNTGATWPDADTNNVVRTAFNVVRTAFTLPPTSKQ